MFPFHMAEVKHHESQQCSAMDLTESEWTVVFPPQTAPSAVAHNST